MSVEVVLRRAVVDSWSLVAAFLEIAGVGSRVMTACGGARESSKNHKADRCL